MKSNVVLIGFMGSGKTTTGKRLSELIGVSFIDTDTIIEESFGMSILKLFEQKGEKFFRNEEQKLCDKLKNQTDLVISTGGGVILQHKNVESLSHNGIIIYLKSNLETLLPRIKENVTRPLFLNAKEEKFAELYRRRHDLYMKVAHHVIDASKKTIEEIVTDIVNIIKKTI
jgi:shikimate kinase